MDKEHVASMTLVSTSQTLTIFTAMMPDFPVVRRSTDEATRNDVRTAEVTASVISLGISFGVALTVGSPTPFIATLALCLVLAGTYEYVMSTTPTEKKEGITA